MSRHTGRFISVLSILSLLHTTPASCASPAPSADWTSAGARLGIPTRNSIRRGLSLRSRHVPFFPDFQSQLEFISSNGPAAVGTDTKLATLASSKNLMLSGGESGNTMKVLFYFAVWYALNVVYNIKNKQVLNRLELPWLVSVAQLAVGALYALLVWASRLRAFPDRGALDLQALLPIGLFHGAGQALTVLSLGAGAVSFTHIVKAMEPFFSAIISAIVSKKVLKPQVYATLIPVVGGVSIAVAKDVSFSAVSFGCAMSSNLAFACRAVFSKSAMTSPLKTPAKPLTAANLFGVVTILAFLMMLPLALLAEGPVFRARWGDAVNGISSGELVTQILLSGFFHYTNNEVMHMALSNVHPITLAVGNTLKRVVIIVAALIVFRNPMSTTTAVGSAVGIGGVLLYTLTKLHYDKLEAQEAAHKK